MMVLTCSAMANVVGIWIISRNENGAANGRAAIQPQTGKSRYFGLITISI
jgi:hypothetical protein